MASSSSHALKIYWPTHLCKPKLKLGYLIGWHHTTFALCVAAIIHDINLKDLKQLVDSFCMPSENTNFNLIDRVCKIKPTILGQLTTSESQYNEHGLDNWLDIQLNNEYVPEPRSIVINKHTVSSYEIVFYDQPNPERLQFLALEPLTLDITTLSTMMNKSSKSTSPSPISISPSSTPSSSSTTPSPLLNENKNKNEKEQKQERLTKQNLEKLICNGKDLSSRNLTIYDPTDDLLLILVQINSSYYLERGIHLIYSKEYPHHEQNHPHHHHYPIYEHGDSFFYFYLFHSLKKVYLFIYHYFYMIFISWLFQTLIMTPCHCILFIIFALSEVVLHILGWKLPRLNVAMKDISAAGQQIDLRLQQLYFWPKQYMMLRKNNRSNTAETRAYYISFYNSMWLVANDIIIGVALGSFLTANCEMVSNKLHEILETYTVDSLQSMMLWFLETPAGLKLNKELGIFLSELFLWLIHLWRECMWVMQPWTYHILYFIGCCGIFGVSMIISLLSDLLAFLTIHIYCFYTVAARIFNWQLISLYALFTLFRGKKRNMLRQRIDNCDYDLDQLLLGTCLFTLLAFLFPTVLIYYLTFALSRVAIIFLQAIMETLLAFFNHFPLFTIMLRIKDPDRVPGGIKFDLFQHDTYLYKHHWFKHTWETWKRPKTRKKSVRFQLPNEMENESPTGAYFHIKNTPIPFSAIFFQYMLLWKRLSSHYFSSYVFRCFLYGEPIKPVPKLQYPMLPAKRSSLKSVWKMIKTMWNK
ncbi:unnamed protein product [Cunninghamella blakesleeana]